MKRVITLLFTLTAATVVYVVVIIWDPVGNGSPHNESIHDSTLNPNPVLVEFTCPSGVSIVKKDNILVATCQ